MPLLWLGLSTIAGIYVSAHIQTGTIFWAAIAIFGLLVSISEYRFSRVNFHPLLSRKMFSVPVSLLLAFLALGAWRFQASIPNPTPGDLAFFQPDPMAEVKGTIISFPELSASMSSALIRVESLLVNGKEIPVEGKMELRLPGGFHLAYGDRLKMTGPLKSTRNKDEPFYASYLVRQGILTRMSYPQIETLSQGNGNPLMAYIYHIRQTAHVFIQNQMPFQESSLLSGILLGIDWNIPRYLEDAYRVTGTVHIIAISGFNIALISGLIVRLFRRIFQPAWAGALAILAIIFYTLMVGAEPSVVRAAIMGSLSIPAFIIGRRTIGIHSLTFAGAVMLLLNPMLLWDLGFQLSFLATLGLMVLANPVIAWFRSRQGRDQPEKKPQVASPAAELIISTLCAQFTVSPVILGLNPAFHPYALAANLIILPLQPPLMILGGMAILANFIFPPFGILLSRLAWPLAAICNQVALHFGKIRPAEFVLPEYSALLAGGFVLVVLLFATVHELTAISRPNPSDKN